MKAVVRTESLLPLLMVFAMGIVEMVIFSQKAFFLPLAILFVFNGTVKIPKQRMQVIYNSKSLRKTKE